MSAAEPPPASPGLAPAILWRLLLPAITGTLTGVCIGTLSGTFEDRGLNLLNRTPGILPVLVAPLALLTTYLVARIFGLIGKPSGAELYIHTYHDPQGRLPLRDVPARLLAATTTVGFGGSQGFESASALLGAAFGDIASRWRALAMSANEGRSLMIAGASAGIAAVFSSPAVGLLYGLEVPFRRDLDGRHLVPAAVASVCAYGARVAVAGARPLLGPGTLPTLDVPWIAGCLLVGLACGIGGRLFAQAQIGLQHLARRGHPLVRIVGASLVFALLVWLGHAVAGTWITLGPGYIASAWLLDGTVVHPTAILAAALLIRTAGTLVCVYGGGGGGVFTALALTGAFLGELVAIALGYGAGSALPLVGAASFLSAGYRLPLSCLLWIGESSGDLVLTLGGTLAIAVAQVFVGDWSVSDAKRDAR